MRIGLLHPGEMGSALGAVLVGAGHRVTWASDGRSSATAERAAGAGLEDVGTAVQLGRVSELVLSVVPPANAAAVAASLDGFTGTLVDANAIAPASTRAIADAVTAAGARYVDGGIIGPPPLAPGAMRLYLSGDGAAEVAGLFDGTAVDARAIGPRIGDASALKMAYAGWSKGTIALLLAMREFAVRAGVEPELIDEWAISMPELAGRLSAARTAADKKGWRWIGEMDEIAASLRETGLPGGFHEAASAIFAGAEPAQRSTK